MQSILLSLSVENYKLKTKQNYSNINDASKAGTRERLQREKTIFIIQERQKVLVSLYYSKHNRLIHTRTNTNSYIFILKKRSLVI